MPDRSLDSRPWPLSHPKKYWSGAKARHSRHLDPSTAPPPPPPSPLVQLLFVLVRRKVDVTSLLLDSTDLHLIEKAGNRLFLASVTSHERVRAVFPVDDDQA